MKQTKYLLYALILCLLSWTTPARAEEDWRQREAELLTAIKNARKAKTVPHPFTLSQLARVREKRGYYSRAIATWRLIKRLHYSKLPPNQSSAPTHTYGQIADFFIRRLRRKQHLVRHPPKMSKQLRRRLAKAQRAGFRVLRKEGSVDLKAQADLDGDLVDEIVLSGKYRPLGKRKQPFLAIVKYNGTKYQVVWRAEGKHKPIIFPYRFKIADGDEDGWKKIRCFFEPETDNVATLYFNGTEAMMMWGF